MKKLCIVFLVLIVGLISMGATKCSHEQEQQGQLIATQAAMIALQTGSTYVNQLVEAKCVAGQWSDVDCAQWRTNWPKVTEVLTNILPWVIDKLIKTATPQELEVITNEIQKAYYYKLIVSKFQ